MDFETKGEARLREAAERAKSVVNLEQSVLAGNQDIPQDRLDALNNVIETEAQKRADWIHKYETARQEDEKKRDNQIVAEFALHQAAMSGNWDDERIKLAEQEHVEQK